MDDNQRWYSRGYVPHFSSSDVIQFITYKLHDSVPPVAEEVISARATHQMSPHERLEDHDDLLDKGYGSCILKYPEVAKSVIDTWHFHHEKKYHLLGWVVMPNHVHVLIKPHRNNEISRIIQSWKSYSSKKIKMSPTGMSIDEKIWMRGYWDRFIRDNDDFYTTLNYIHENPIRAGLVDSAGEWEFSSYIKWYRDGKLLEADWDAIFKE